MIQMNSQMKRSKNKNKKNKFIERDSVLYPIFVFSYLSLKTIIITLNIKNKRKQNKV